MFVFNLRSELNATISLLASIRPSVAFGVVLTPIAPVLTLKSPVTSTVYDGAALPMARRVLVLSQWKFVLLLRVVVPVK